MMSTLSPTQQKEFDRLAYALQVGSAVALWGGTGTGKTTILQQLHRVRGGKFLNMKDFVEAMRGQHPLAVEETFERLMMDALIQNDTVILDDLHLLYDVVCGCGYDNAYPRAKFLDAPLTTLLVHAEEAGKRLVFGSEGSTSGVLSKRCYFAGIEKFTEEDYAFLCHVFLEPEQAANLDYKQIHRFAPRLNAHQLRSACAWLKPESELDTEKFVNYLLSQRLASNVDLEEVAQVDLYDLKGLDEMIQSLEAHIILPLENDALAQELDIKPKRGVLLSGPPGTGKTTVGRALAHKLKSKFFLIDGTFISGSQNFYGRVHQVFEAAKQNAPAIVFIDDSDVIFQSGEELGLYRYLLTLMDGLESESAGRVCVMMTAMDEANLPPALVRSGRIELWLRTSLPDEDARTAILRERVLRMPSAIGEIDVTALAAATESLTGADIKRVMEDGKILLAYDKARNLPLRPATDYFLEAIATVRENKERYAEAEARARQQHPNRPSFFDAMASMNMMYGQGYEGMEEE